MKPSHPKPAPPVRFHGATLYEVDGALVSRQTLAREAEAAGVNSRTLYRRLARGDRTRERLFRTPGPWAASARQKADAAEVAAACRALDSRPRLWTGY